MVVYVEQSTNMGIREHLESLEDGDEKCLFHQGGLSMPDWGNRVLYFVVQILFGLTGVWLNRMVLKDLKILRSNQIINTFVLFIISACLALSCLQLLNGFRFIAAMDLVWKNEWISYLYLMSWHFLTTLLNCLAVLLSLIRYLYVFKKSTIRALREESHLARSCGIGAVLFSALMSFALETVLSKSMFHVMWVGDRLEENHDYFLAAFFYLVMAMFSFVGLFLYSKIGEHSGVGGNLKQSKKDFSDIGTAAIQPQQSLSADPGSVSSASASVKDNQSHRNQNFVPWQVHRQVLVILLLAIFPVLTVFSLLGPLCLSHVTFWTLNITLTLQVTLCSLGPPLCHLFYCYNDKFNRRLTGDKSKTNNKYEIQKEDTTTTLEIDEDDTITRAPIVVGQTMWPKPESKDHLFTLQTEASVNYSRAGARRKNWSEGNLSTLSTQEEAEIPASSTLSGMMDYYPAAAVPDESPCLPAAEIERQKMSSKLRKTASLPYISHHQQQQTSCSRNQLKKESELLPRFPRLRTGPLCPGAHLATLINGKQPHNEKRQLEHCRREEKFPAVIYKPSSSTLTMLRKTPSTSSIVASSAHRGTMLNRHCTSLDNVAIPVPKKVGQICSLLRKNEMRLVETEDGFLEAADEEEEEEKVSNCTVVTTTTTLALATTDNAGPQNSANGRNQLLPEVLIN